MVSSDCPFSSQVLLASYQVAGPFIGDSRNLSDCVIPVNYYHWRQHKRTEISSKSNTFGTSRCARNIETCTTFIHLLAISLRISITEFSLAVLSCHFRNLHTLPLPEIYVLQYSKVWTADNTLVTLPLVSETHPSIADVHAGTKKKDKFYGSILKREKSETKC